MRGSRLRKMKSHAQGLTNQFKEIMSDRLGMIGVVILGLFLFIAVFAPFIAPYSGVGSTYHSDGRLAKLEPPSRYHWFGTTNLAEDIFSQTLMGSRLAILVGLISAICVTVIGTNIGLIAGYFGRWTDEILMRITDIAYGIPFLPFGIVLVALLGASKWNIIIAISVLMWRTSARVVRAQVLSLRERPFIWSAKTSGASDLRILYVHIAPNILPLSFLYVALGLGWAVTAEASLSFIGLGDPAAVSWGRMLYFAFWAGAIRTAWWWVIPPGVSIGLFVLSCYLIARAYERILNPKLREI
jgi:peptide/nickel transport system permease protein